MDEKDKVLLEINAQLKEFKTQVFSYQRMVREAKIIKDNMQLEIESIRDRLDSEISKRIKIEK